MKTINPYVLKDNDLLLDVDLSKFSQSSKKGDIRKYVLKIRDLPSEDKPRERLVKEGPAILSTAELLAIIFNTGSVKEGVLEMASRVLKDYGEKALISQTDAGKIAKDLDIPELKASQIVACAELGRRFFDKDGINRATVRTAEDVFEYLRDMQNLPKEHLRGIYLNSHHKVIHDEVISIGTVNSNLIHPREVFKPAIEYGAAAVILAHNHPSGILEPSEADVEITKQLVAVGKIIGINLLDHVIIGKDQFISIDIDYLN
ncbi:MAG: DNA repair protein RadC [bacterium]